MRPRSPTVAGIKQTPLRSCGGVWLCAEAPVSRRLPVGPWRYRDPRLKCCPHTVTKKVSGLRVLPATGDARAVLSHFIPAEQGKLPFSESQTKITAKVATLGCGYSSEGRGGDFPGTLFTRKAGSPCVPSRGCGPAGTPSLFTLPCLSRSFPEELVTRGECVANKNPSFCFRRHLCDACHSLFLCGLRPGSALPRSAVDGWCWLTG